jgi:hypothetical protein
MCLTIKDLNDRILICKTRSDLNHNSNHVFIETILSISINETTFLERFNWDRLNMKKIKNIFNYLLLVSSSHFFNAAQIDIYTKFVCAAIAEVISASISKFKTSTRVTSEFDKACNLTRTRANQVRRTFQDELVAQENTKQTFQIWRKSKAIKKRIIRKILRITHRNVVFDAIDDAQKTLKLVKWAKNCSTSFKLITSFLRRSNVTMIVIKETRIQCLIDFFSFRSSSRISTISRDQYIQITLISSRSSRTRSIKQSLKSSLALFRRIWNTQSSHKARFFAYHVCRQMNLQSKSSIKILSQAFQRIHHDVSS